MRASWKELTFPEKLLAIAGTAVAVVIVILAVLQFAGIMEHADNIYMPGLGVLMLIQAAENWKTNRSTAYISLFAGLFVLIVVAVHFLTLR